MLKKRDRGRGLVFAGAVAVLVGAVMFPAPQAARTTTIRSSLPELRSLWHLVRSTLSRNAISFAGKTGPVTGFSAGSLYPQIWVRDMASILPAAKYYYPAEALVSGLEEILAAQKSDGSLPDWVDNRGRVDKNTTETDQETSMILAAAEVVRILGPDWLRTPIAGRNVLDRLDQALTFVREKRFDPEHGLVKGAHTADWGDVGIEDGDSTAIYVDAETHWTCDIYDQSQFFGAAVALAGMWEREGKKERAEGWKDQAEAVRRAADRLLWQNDRGFFRVHIHLSPLAHPFAEDDMFALGGNTEAILSGLAGPEQAARIIRTALSRQSTFKMPTIGATLLPPYPRGTFRHPMVDDPYEYQNGGLWDWFAGKLLRTMFDRGFSAEARAKLLEIARKNIASGGLFEWDAPDGSGRGSGAFSGSAGSLALALAEGYFGVRLTRDRLDFEPRLAEDSARVVFRLPAADVSASYEYDWEPEQSRVTFRYGSTVSRAGRIRLLLPQALSDKSLDVRRDGRPYPFALERLESETRLVLETDFADHVLVIRGLKTKRGDDLP